MSWDNFLVQDVLRSAMGFGVFPLLLFVPGYVVGWMLDLLQFRTRSLTARCALSLVLSIAVAPIVTFLLARFIAMQAAFGFYFVAAVAFCAILITDALRRRAAPGSAAGARDSLFAWSVVIAVVWSAIAVLLMSDMQIGPRLYPTILSFDYAKHIAVTNAITRTGVPPANPSFYPGHPITLYYYYYWFLLCSLVEQLGGAHIGPRGAVIAGTAWSGITLIAIVALYLRFVAPQAAANRRRHVYIGLALLLISGLDIIPALMETVITRLQGSMFIYASVEWWNEQVTAWPTAVFWVPHHIAGLVAGLTAFLVLGTADRAAPRGRQALAVAVCALGLASALGLSIWVAFAFAIFWGVWILVALRKGWSHEARLAIVAGVIGAVLSLPFLIDLKRASYMHGVPVLPSVRVFVPVRLMADYYGFPGSLTQLLYLLALPLNYFMELGFFAIAGVVYWRRRLRTGEPLSRNEMGIVTMALVGAFVATFLKATIRNNDLGWRGVMLLQLPLLLWSADVVALLFDRARRAGREALAGAGSGSSRPVRVALVVTLLIGAMPAPYDAVMMKLHPLLNDYITATVRGTLDGGSNEGRRAYGVREAYSWIDQHLPVSAIVQHNPAVRFEQTHQLYGNRQVIAADSSYGTLYGIPTTMYDPVARPIERLFKASPAADRALLDGTCRRFGITALVAKPSDPVWRNRASWVWREQPVYSDPYARVFACKDFAGDAQGPAQR